MPERDDLTTEALAAVLAELRARFAAGADPQALRVYLASRGYDGRRIEQVLRALAAQGEGALGAATAPAPAFGWVPAAGAVPALRAPAAHERARFAPDAWGLLLQRQAAAGWSVAELEHVIERALVHIDGRIAVDDLRALMEGASGGQPADPTTVH